MILDERFHLMALDAGIDEIELNDLARQFSMVYPEEAEWQRLLTEKLTQSKSGLDERKRIEQKRTRILTLENQIRAQNHLDLEKDLDKRIADLEKRLGKE